jgi:RNA polymerase sigma-70 factor (ECF subfamily)
VRQHDDRLRGLAYKLLGDRHRMEDAMQEAYVRAYRSMGRFRRDAELGSWLYRIVYNACVDELRRSGRRPMPVDAGDVAWDAPSPRPGPERSVHAADSARRALASLPDDQRATVLLVDGEGFDNVTAAEILGVAPGTVASRLSRARAEMRRVLAKDDT